MSPSQIPMLGPGTRVELEASACGTLACRAARFDGESLHLTVTAAGAALAPRLPPGGGANLTMYCGGTCWECAATVREWLHGSPSTLIVSGLAEWRENQRRRERRAVCQHDALLLLTGGERSFGRSLDMSESGVSLLLPDVPRLMIGAKGWLTLRVTQSQWCTGIPVELIRRERWIQSGGRWIRVGAALGFLSDAQYQDWESCLYADDKKENGDGKTDGS